MADIVSPEVRSRMMSGIGAKDTKPELIVRRGLHRRGFRFRLHDRKLPGKPDLVLPKHRAVIFVHGCFWHRHDCHLFKWPKTRVQFWKEKLDKNVVRDKLNRTKLLQSEWRVGEVWECSLKGATKVKETDAIGRLEAWLLSDTDYIQLSEK